MTEGNKTISKDNKLRRVFNRFFSKTFDELKTSSILHYTLDNTNDALKEALKYFENHPNINKCKEERF